MAIVLALSACLGLYAWRAAGGTMGHMGLGALALAALLAIYAVFEPKAAAHHPPAGTGRHEVPPPADFVALWPLAGMPRDENPPQAGRRGRQLPNRRGDNDR